MKKPRKQEKKLSLSFPLKGTCAAETLALSRNDACEWLGNTEFPKTTRSAVQRRGPRRQPHNDGSLVPSGRPGSQSAGCGPGPRLSVLMACTASASLAPQLFCLWASGPLRTPRPDGTCSFRFWGSCVMAVCLLGWQNGNSMFRKATAWAWEEAHA